MNRVFLIMCTLMMSWPGKSQVVGMAVLTGSFSLTACAVWPGLPSPHFPADLSCLQCCSVAATALANASLKNILSCYCENSCRNIYIYSFCTLLFAFVNLTKKIEH